MKKDLSDMWNIFLVRHGETPWNADNNRYCGRTDAPLTEKGQQQALLLKEELKNIKLNGAYSSPLQRAYITASVASGNIPVIKDDRLIEVDFGNWENKTKEEFVAEDPESWKEWTNGTPGARAGRTGETAEEVANRVNDFFESLVANNPPGNYLVAAHNGVNRLFLSGRLGMPLYFYRRIWLDNATITMFSIEANKEFVLKKLNSKM